MGPLDYTTRIDFQNLRNYLPHPGYEDFWYLLMLIIVISITLIHKKLRTKNWRFYLGAVAILPIGVLGYLSFLLLREYGLFIALRSAFFLLISVPLAAESIYCIEEKRYALCVVCLILSAIAVLSLYVSIPYYLQNGH